MASSLAEFSNSHEWRSLKRGFVCDACDVFKLPKPFDGYLNHGTRVAKDRGSNMPSQGEMPPLSRLKRDNLWVHSGSRLQLEFGVDNEKAAGLMNVEVRVENEFYEPMIARMRQSLFVAFLVALITKASTSLAMTGVRENTTSKRMQCATECLTIAGMSWTWTCTTSFPDCVRGMFCSCARTEALTAPTAQLPSSWSAANKSTAHGKRQSAATESY